VAKATVLLLKELKNIVKDNKEISDKEKQHFVKRTVVYQRMCYYEDKMNHLAYKTVRGSYPHPKNFEEAKEIIEPLKVAFKEVKGRVFDNLKVEEKL